MKIQLKSVSIKKYTCIESEQNFEIDPNVTVLVGMNESGKTSVLKALAKTNYFEDDDDFKFNVVHDYPRKEKKALDKSKENPVAVIGTFEILPELTEILNKDVGENVFTGKTIIHTKRYNNEASYEQIDADKPLFLTVKLNSLGINTEALYKKLTATRTAAEFNAILDSTPDESAKKSLKTLGKYFENKWNWENPIAEYIFRCIIEPNMPKFLYYDEYYALPSKISVEKIMNSKRLSEETKTAKALFELADINPEELVDAEDFESYKAELEATQANISETLFKYWTTNTNIEINFDVEKVINRDNSHNHYITEHLLHIRVKNKRTTVTLPLHNRSKGFNWFFSFLVWFKKIQENKENNYILLLDEPGLNLHASAQEDLLKFIEDLSKEYQIIYTTHSPFMIDSEHLERIRTVHETKEGSIISDSIQEKDPKTLFPLQAALGYNIAQNLFISPKNLLVEGVSDLAYLTVLSNVLQQAGRTGLREDITIVPVGGMDKVATFISLLRGNKLDIVCLLDSFIDPSGKARIDNLIAEKIIKDKYVKFYDEFTSQNKADIEDLFEKEEYLVLFNEAHKGKLKELKLADLNDKIENILIQINKALTIERFNHYAPASLLAQKAPGATNFKKETLDRFEKLFIEINKLFN